MNETNTGNKKLPKEILYATQNDSKLSVLKSVLGDRYTIKNLKDIGIENQVVEDGLNPRENALKKARSLFEQTGKPSFAMDFGFFIEGLEKDKQPGPFVKRLVKAEYGNDPTDEDVLKHYINIVDSFGGKADAYWIRAFALVSTNGEFVDEVKIPKVLVSTPSKNRLKGFPMTSIQIDPKTGKYDSDLTKEERAKSHKETDDRLRDFVESHL